MQRYHLLTLGIPVTSRGNVVAKQWTNNGADCAEAVRLFAMVFVTTGIRENHRLLSQPAAFGVR